MALSQQVIGYIKTLAMVIVYYLIGVGFYHYQEGWNFSDCAYFITVSICTVGYGVLHPTSNSSRIWTVFYIITGIIMILSAGSEFARNTLVRLQNAYLESLKLSRQQKSLVKILISICLIIFVLLVGCLSYQSLEGYSSNVSFYFVMVTILTIGYGDFAPQTEAGRTFSIFYILLCVIIFASAIHNIGDAITEVKQDRLRDMIVASKFKRHVVQVQMSSFDYASESSDRQTASLTSNSHDAFTTGNSVNNGISYNVPWYTALYDAAFSPNILPSDLSNQEHASLQNLGQMSESEFILDLLLRLDIVDKRRHIDPLIHSFREFKENERKSTSSINSDDSLSK